MEWKSVEDYKGIYEVSNTGKIRSLDKYIEIEDCWGRKYKRFQKGRELKINMGTNGYYRVELNHNGIGKKFSVHVLVAIAFVANYENKSQVNHIDGNKTNNNSQNLEWVTPKENTQHSIRIGLRNFIGENNSNSVKIKCIEYDIIFNTLTDASKWLIKMNIPRSKKVSTVINELRRENAYKLHWERI